MLGLKERLILLTESISTSMQSKKQLSAEELKLLDNIKENEVKIAKMLSEKISTKYNESYAGENTVIYIPKARNASEFFDPNSETSGVCRHQVCILNAVLNKLKIDNVIQSSIALDEGDGHAWIYLPKHNLILDPTNGFSGDPNNFHRRILRTINQVIDEENSKRPWWRKSLDQAQ